jgi:hypothetical protein
LTLHHANSKKLAVLAAVATVLTAAGLSLGTVTAPADRGHDPDPHPHIVRHDPDRFFEGTRADRFFMDRK